MTDLSSSGQEPRPQDDESVGSLLRLVNPRPTLSTEQTARLKSAVRPHWQRQVGAGRIRRRMVWGGGLLAAAAALLLVVGLQPRNVGSPARDDRPEVFNSTFAHLEKATGPVTLRSGERSGVPLTVGDVVPTGGVVETAKGRAALRLASGLSLRLDRTSSVRLVSGTVSGTVVELTRGRLYIDSEGAPMGESVIEVRTPFGRVQDIGTQFEVRLGDASLRLRVREGRVRLIQEEETREAGAGEELRIAADGVSQRPMVVYGAPWAWVQEVASAPSFEGQTLDVFLAWVVRESGWRLLYAEESLAASAPTTVLHGPVEGMPPQRALEVALQATDLSHRLEDGVLIIESARR